MKQLFAKDGKPIPSFLHTTQDASKNQPITKHELDEMSETNDRFAMTTGGKANRKERRKWEKKKKALKNKRP